MNWINRHVTPRLKNFFARRAAPDTLWIKCPATGDLVLHADVVRNQYVIPKSNHHMPMSAKQRLEWLFDTDTQVVHDTPAGISDPLQFRDKKRYTDRLREARSKTTLADAVYVGSGTVGGLPITAVVLDFAFMGGTLGVSAGNALWAGIATAIDARTPFIAFTASGGARMQEGMFALMQMPRAVLGVRRLREAALPYIVVLTNPTTGGVAASFGMLGDVHVAEPGALIGFAGPRVIEQTIGENLPDEFQRSEFLLTHGMVDMVVHRHRLRDTLASLCRKLLKQPAPELPAASRHSGPESPSPAGSHPIPDDAAPTVPDSPSTGEHADPAGSTEERTAAVDDPPAPPEESGADEPGSSPSPPVG